MLLHFTMDIIVLGIYVSMYTDKKYHVFHINLVGNGEKVQKPMENMLCISYF